jgi:hypothetical protein
LCDFLWKLQEAIIDVVPEMPIFAEHSRNGVIFRGHPNYRGKGTWRDWAMVKWNEGQYPAQIWCFVDLTGFPTGKTVQVGDIVVEKGIYAVVESATVDVDSEAISDIWIPITTVVKRMSAGGEVMEKKFYLADVEAFVSPLCVMPNIGAKPNCRYLMMKPREKWADDFIQWLRMDHKVDRMEMDEEKMKSEKIAETTMTMNSDSSTEDSRD